MMTRKRRHILYFILIVCCCFAAVVTASAARLEDMTDIPENAWYSDSVAYCLQNNYMVGVSDTSFHPDGEVTRASMVQVLYNLEGRPPVTADHPFVDVREDVWYYSAVLWARSANITSGTSSTTFSPDTPITREQVATMFANYARYTGAYGQQVEQTTLDRFADRNLIAGYAREAVAWVVQSGLMSGTNSVTFAPQETCTRAQMAQVLYNAFAQNPEEQEVPEAPADEVEYMLSVQIGDTVFTATLEENGAVDALITLLRSGPITIQMNDYGGFEKVGSLGQSLPTSNSQTTTQAGDIVLYQGNQIVMFYGSNTWSYTRLAKINDLTGWEEALGRGNVSATFSLTEANQ